MVWAVLDSSMCAYCARSKLLPWTSPSPHSMVTFLIWLFCDEDDSADVASRLVKILWV
jgi:hypothetical protein